MGITIYTRHNTKERPPVANCFFFCSLILPFSLNLSLNECETEQERRGLVFFVLFFGMMDEGFWSTNFYPRKETSPFPSSFWFVIFPVRRVSDHLPLFVFFAQGSRWPCEGVIIINIVSSSLVRCCKICNWGEQNRAKGKVNKDMGRASSSSVAAVVVQRRREGLDQSNQARARVFVIFTPRPTCCTTWLSQRSKQLDSVGPRSTHPACLRARASERTVR